MALLIGSIAEHANYQGGGEEYWKPSIKHEIKNLVVSTLNLYFCVKNLGIVSDMSTKYFLQPQKSYIKMFILALCIYRVFFFQTSR